MTTDRTALRRAMRTVVRRSAALPLPIVADDGTRPIVVSLPDDSLKNVVERVLAFGGRANVFVAFEDEMRIVEMEVDHEGAAEALLDKAHANTTVGLYVDLLIAAEGPVTLQINVDEHATTRVSDRIAYAF